MNKPDNFDKQITQALFQEGNYILASPDLKSSIDAKIDTEINNTLISIHSHRNQEDSMKKPNFKWLVAAVAAVCILIPTGVYASGKITGYVSSISLGRSYDSYSDLEKSQDYAGFSFYTPETFSNEYTFLKMDVCDTDKLDENNNRVGSFREWYGYYQREASPDISLIIHEILPESAEVDSTATEETDIDGIHVSYTVSHYKFVPVDYELTAADEAFMEQPNCYISVGSESVEETDCYYTSWEKDNLCYALMYSGTELPAKECFTMAEEIITH